MRKITPPPDSSILKPILQVPPGATDCHFHIFGPQSTFPFVVPRPLDAADCSLEDLLDLQVRLGMDRGVVVQTALYGSDNSCLLDALRREPKRLRGVAAVQHAITDKQLKELTDAGVRGNRFSFMRSPDIDRDLIARLHEFGWHPQYWFEGEQQALAWKDTMLDSPGNFVIDHMGWQPCGLGLNSFGFRTILECLETGRCWVKLSGPNRFSMEDVLPYSDVAPFAQKLIETAPDRVIWGSDWPHPNWFKPMPNDARLLDLLMDWAPDESVRNKILVENPEGLFGFNLGEANGDHHTN